MKRVVVTGATGFIGRQALLPLLDSGYEVHALYTRNPIESDSRIHWHKCDLFEKDTVEGLFSDIKPTHLLHLAWYVSPGDYKTSPENERWIDASLDLLKTFQKNGGSRAVFAGTCMEYDWTTGQEYLKEDSPVSSDTVYGRAKNETRLRSEDFAKAVGLSFVWGRIFNLYGPYEASRRFVPQVIQSFLRGDMPAINPDNPILDFSHVCDIAGAFTALCDSDATGIINIGSGNATSLYEIANVIADILEKKELVSAPTTSTTQTRVVADITRLRDEVGWHARFDLRAGLEETIEWWKKTLQNETTA